MFLNGLNCLNFVKVIEGAHYFIERRNLSKYPYNIPAQTPSNLIRSGVIRAKVWRHGQVESRRHPGLVVAGLLGPKDRGGARTPQRGGGQDALALQAVGLTKEESKWILFDCVMLRVKK